jgi:SPX domain protein involved in polyphosphate accumulation
MQMPDLGQLIPLAVLLVLFCLALFQIAVGYNDKINLIKELTQAYNDIDILSTRLSEVAESKNISEIPENDFIKFLSDSREDAFGFITNVQETILELKTATEAKDSELESSAYNKLISFLPNDNDMVK